MKEINKPESQVDMPKVEQSPKDLRNMDKEGQSFAEDFGKINSKTATKADQKKDGSDLGKSDVQGEDIDKTKEYEQFNKDLSDIKTNDNVALNTDVERTNEILSKTDLSREDVQNYLDTAYWRKPEIGDTFRNEGIIVSGENVQIPRSKAYLDEDGFIDWNKHAPENGYMLDENGKAIKSEILEKSDENRFFDRYGDEYGRYLAPMDKGNGSFEFEKRSLPYVEDKDNQHVYEEVGNLNDIAGDINKNSDMSEDRKQELLNKLETNGGKTYIGEASPAFDQPGGAKQVETPLTVNELCEIGTLERYREVDE